MDDFCFGNSFDARKRLWLNVKEPNHHEGGINSFPNIDPFRFNQMDQAVKIKMMFLGVFLNNWAKFWFNWAMTKLGNGNYTPNFRLSSIRAWPEFELQILGYPPYELPGKWGSARKIYFIWFGKTKDIKWGKQKKEGSLSLERESLHLLTNYIKINLEATRFSHQIQII